MFLYEIIVTLLEKHGPLTTQQIADYTKAPIHATNLALRFTKNNKQLITFFDGLWNIA